MKITKIEAYDDNNGFYKLFSEDGYLLSLSQEIIKKFNISVGSDVDAKRLNEINEAALVRKARERLLYCLDRRIHSRYELCKKLERNYPPHIIEKAIEQIESLGLIDDLEFATRYATELFRVKKKGRFAIKDALFKKGIDRRISEKVINELLGDGDEEIDAAVDIARRYADELDTPKGRQKIFAAIVRRGYSYNTASAAVRRLSQSKEFFED